MVTSNPEAMQSNVKPSTEIFSDEQRQRINRFFALIRVGWGVAKYNSQFGDDEDVRHQKRFHAQRILQYTDDKLSQAVEMAVSLRGSGDDDFTFPDVAKILGLIGTDWESKRMHRLASEVMAEPILDLSAPRLEDESNMDTGLMANIREADSPEAHLDLLKNLGGQTKGD
jgi:hypothetical protein